jgi:hypothetical protein
MRDFRDAKAMAHALRAALKAKSIETTHSESLELIANAFGYANWNVLSAKIEAAAPGPTPPATLHCSFCGKSQHEVRKLIAGPSVNICDECAELCMDIVEEESPLRKVLGLLAGAGEGGAGEVYRAALDLVRSEPTPEVASYVQAARRSIKQRRLLLDGIRGELAMRDGRPAAGDDAPPSSRFAFLTTKTRDELSAMQQESALALKRHEDALRIGTTVLGERSQELGS